MIWMAEIPTRPKSDLLKSAKRFVSSAAFFSDLTLPIVKWGEKGLTSGAKPKPVITASTSFWIFLRTSGSFIPTQITLGLFSEGKQPTSAIVI
jgi:hypothetical protein